MQTRNIMIAKRRTTIRLEAAVWDALDEICEKEGINRHQICTRIDAARDGANRAQAVRATVINYLRLAASGSAGNRIDAALNGL
ncbi:MAG: ribbon-helix-helix domain-containing protein [Rhodospirillales bacterium]|nr:ribbon-helix-helix domain-containing protein [Rhodospirillales bacterium]